MKSFVLALALVVAVTGEGTQPREADQYPFIVSIHRNSKTHSFLCAGSLIASSWVLTSANCLPKFACKIRYDDMITVDSATYRRILKRIHHINSRSVYTPAADKNRLTPKSNNIGLAQIEEILNMTFGQLSGVDYPAMVGRQVTTFEFRFMPVFKSKIYEINRKRLSNYSRRKKKKFLFARFEGDNDDYSFIPYDSKVLRAGQGIAVMCQMKHFAGPNICVANKCFDFDNSDPHSDILSPDYGAPLVHGGTIVGVTSEVEAYYSRYTPVSPYLDWIRSQVTFFTPKQINRTL